MGHFDGIACDYGRPRRCFCNGTRTTSGSVGVDGLASLPAKSEVQKEVYIVSVCQYLGMRSSMATRILKNY